MRIGICEDEQPIRERLMTLIKTYPIDEQLEVLTFVSGEEILADAEGFDIAFLDIELGDGINGLTTAEALQKKRQQTLIVFVSGYYRYITSALHLEPFEFLIKPIDEVVFAQEFERCLERYHNDHRYYVINCFGEDIPLLIKEILYVKVDKYKLQFYMLGKGEPYEIYGHLKNVKDALQPYRFALANQGCLINLRYIYGKADEEVRLVYHDKKGRQEIVMPVSRRQRKDLQQRIRDFMLEEGIR